MDKPSDRLLVPRSIFNPPAPRRADNRTFDLTADGTKARCRICDTLYPISAEPIVNVVQSKRASNDYYPMCPNCGACDA